MMKTWLPWLLVPFAVWLGLSGERAGPPVVDAAKEAKPQPVAPAWLAEATSEIRRSDFDSLLRQLVAIEGPPFRAEEIAARRLICARLAELDPAAALVRLAEQEAETATWARQLILAEWALLDSEAAWNRIPAGPEGDEDRRNVTRRLLHEDRELFMRWFRRVREPMPDGDPAWLLVAERHADELQEIAEQCAGEAADSREARRFAPLFELLAKHRAATDPAAALEWATALQDEFRPLAVRGVIEAWGGTDPVAAWKKALEIRAEGLRSGDRLDLVIQTLLTKIAKDDPAAAMDLILGLGGRNQVQESGGVDAMASALGSLLRSGEMDPLEAYRLLNSAKGTASYIPLNALRRLWVGLPPDRLEKAARDILAEPREGERDTAIGGIAATWMGSDPDGALALISEIEDPALRHRTLAMAVANSHAVPRDPLQQVALLERIPPEDRAGTFATMITYVGGDLSPGEVFMGRPETNPGQVAALLAEAPPSEEMTRAARINALLWGELDPTAALGWAAGLGDAEARQAAYTGAVDAWSYHDPFAAAAWLAEEPASPERDAATVPLVRRVAASDPAGAWEWAASIGDAGMQTEARLAALTAWSAQAPEEAHAALRRYTSSLPPAEAAEFIKRHSGK